MKRARRNGDLGGGEGDEIDFVKGIERETEEYRRRRSRNDESFTWRRRDLLLINGSKWFPMKKRRTTRQEEEEEEEEEEEDDDDEEEEEVDGAPGTNVTGSKNGDCGDRSISCTLNDADLLDCPICFDNLSIPVFQCWNGHIACSSCCAELGNKCPTCSSHIGKIRCRAVENILESLEVSCRNVKYGCTEMVIFSKKHEHEEMCTHGPCTCPLRDCGFIDSSKNLYLHFSTKHSESAKSFSTSKPILYDIKATTVDSSIELLLHAEFVPGWVKLEHCTLTKFLVVPSGYVGLDGLLVLVLRIYG